MLRSVSLTEWGVLLLPGGLGVVGGVRHVRASLSRFGGTATRSLSGADPTELRFDNRRPRVKQRSLATRAPDAQGGDPAFVSFFLLPLALVAPSFRRTRPSSHRLSIAPAGRGIDANKHLCVAFRLFCDNQGQRCPSGQINIPSTEPRLAPRAVAVPRSTARAVSPLKAMAAASWI